MNPSVGAVPALRIELGIGHEAALPARAWCAHDPRGLVAVVHGLGEHGGRYAALAADLVRARFTVVAVDLPGHGEAPGARGDVPSWIAIRDRVVPRLLAASHGLPGQPPDLPRVLLGHSMGAVMALDHALAHPKEIHAAVASGPAFRSTIAPWWKLVLDRVAPGTSPSSGFPHGLEESGMSRDPDVLALRESDPLVHDKISPRLYFAFEDARQRVMRGARRLDVPVLVLHGAADRVVDPRGSLEFCGAAPRDLCRLITYSDGYHEIFNDPVREQAVRDLVGWLDAVVVL